MIEKDKLYEYKPDTYEEVGFDVYCATEIIKYLLNLEPGDEDEKLLTPELLEKLKRLRDNCDELVRTFDYYFKK